MVLGEFAVSLRRFILLVFLFFLSSGIIAAQTISGYVYDDANFNGMFDAGEVGISNVPVSDGIRFVQTDADGFYRITVDVSDDPQLADGGWPVVSVTWPTGRWPTSIWWRNTEQIGQHNTCNFGLKSDEQSLPFMFVHATDVHVWRGGQEKFTGFRRDMDNMAGCVRFAFLTGDLIDLADRQDPSIVKPQLAFFNELAENFPVNLFCTPGNHDVVGIRPDRPGSWASSDPNHAYRWYTRDVGPLRWSFNYAGIHFVGLDYLERSNDGNWHDDIPQVAVDWLAEDLASLSRGTRIFIFVHYRSDRMAALVRQYSVEHIFEGHIHSVVRDTWNGAGISQAGSLSMMSPTQNPNQDPIGYDIVVIGDKLTLHHRALGDPYVPKVEGDFDKDCRVNLADFAVIALTWLTGRGYAKWNPELDISNPGDGIINMLDIATFTDNWLTDSWLTSFRDGLKAHWKLDEASGSVARDSTGDYDGTLHSGPLWRPAGGEVNGALEFDGVDDYVSAPFILDPADGEFSAFAWVRSGKPGQVVISQTGYPVGANWLCTASPNGSLMTELMASARGGSALVSETVITDGNWHHIGFAWDGSYRTLYVDSAEVAKDVKPLSRLKGASGGLHFGAGEDLQTAGFFSGLIDDIRIYNKALNAKDIQQ